MTIPVFHNEHFKAAAHGLLFGCALPIVAYNVAAGKRRNIWNIVVYSAFLGFELWNIIEHVRTANRE